MKEDGGVGAGAVVETDAEKNTVTKKHIGVTARNGAAAGRQTGKGPSQDPLRRRPTQEEILSRRRPSQELRPHRQITIQT